MVERAPNCEKCAYYYITWELDFPKGCKMFGIKTVQLPSIEVRQNTGRNCPSFIKSLKIKD